MIVNKPDFRRLWGRLRSVYTEYGEIRKLSVLDNHTGNKSGICKRLGVICDSDVNRIALRLKKRGKTNGK